MAKNLVAVVDKDGAIQPDATFEKLVDLLETATVEVVKEGITYAIDPENKRRYKSLTERLGKTFLSDDARISGRGRDAKVWDVAAMQVFLSDSIRDNPGATKSNQVLFACTKYNASRPLEQWLNESFINNAVKTGKLTWIPSPSAHVVTGEELTANAV